MTDGWNWNFTNSKYLAAKSQKAGSPKTLTILQGAPCAFSPCWKAAPSFAAQTLLPGSSCAASSSSAITPRILWCLGAQNTFFVFASPYRHLKGTKHRAHQLLPVVVKHALEDFPQLGSEKKDRDGKLVLRQAAIILRCLAADMQSWAIRALGWVLTHTFRWLFGGEIYVDQSGLARLRDLHAQGCALVYVPTHKSHVDYLMLSYILFASGLPCPHIAAGDNLALPLIGRWLRHCGAFFIRRTSHGAQDSMLYKRVLAGYVRALLEQGHSVEFFIEGGRSRDGRVNSPKLGLLSYVVDAVIDGDSSKPVVCVPVAMSYDLLVEERALAKQLAGASKRKESLGGLLRTVVGLARTALLPWSSTCGALGRGGFHGRASVRFGREIRVDVFLQGHSGGLSTPHEVGRHLGGASALVNGDSHGEVHSLMHCPKGGCARRSVVVDLGEQIASELRTCNVLTSAVLMAGAMEAALAQQGDRCWTPRQRAAGGAARGAGISHTRCHGSALATAVLASHQVACHERGGCPASETGHALADCKHAVASATATPYCSVAGDGAGPAGSVPLETLQQSVDWLGTELEHRGAAVMKLPSAQTQGAHDALLRVVGLLSGCLSVAEARASRTVPAASQKSLVTASSSSSSSTSCSDLSEAARGADAADGNPSTCPLDSFTGRGSSNAAGSKLRVLCSPGLQACLRWHSRLNQLLPWVFGEGLIVCALLGELESAKQSSSSASSIGAGRLVRISRAAVCRRALWLRQLLAPEVETALSRDALNSEKALGVVLDGMVQQGAVASTPDSAWGGDTGCEFLLRLAPAGTGRHWAIFCARILGPPPGYYAAVLRTIYHRLSEQPAGVNSKALLQEAQAQLLEQYSAQAAIDEAGGMPGPHVRVVPSLMLAQGAITALTSLGVLVAHGEAGSPRGMRVTSVPDAAEAAAVEGPHAVPWARQLAAELQASASGNPGCAQGVRGNGETGGRRHGPVEDVSVLGASQTVGIGDSVEVDHSICSRASAGECTSNAIAQEGEKGESRACAKHAACQADALFTQNTRRGLGGMLDGSESGDDPIFDPIAASVGAGLCNRGGANSAGSSPGSSSSSMNRMAVRQAEQHLQRRPRQQKHSESRSLKKRFVFKHTQPQQSHLHTAGKEAVQRQQAVFHPSADILILGEADASIEAVHAFLESILVSCVA